MAIAQGLPPGQLPTLTGEWWQWALSIPTSVNPQLDTTGANCMVGQRGTIWFLAGVFGGGSATRACSVPENSTLFFPVSNAVNIDTPNVCGQGPEHLTVKNMRDASKSTIDSVTNLSLTVDGNPINKTLLQRVQSQIFEVALPEDNVFDKPCMDAGLGNVPTGIYSPAVDDGYYASLEPLKSGNHTIHIHAEGGGGSQDVTYNLTVFPVSLK